jgi:hypothetical protein
MPEVADVEFDGTLIEPNGALNPEIWFFFKEFLRYCKVSEGCFKIAPSGIELGESGME